MNAATVCDLIESGIIYDYLGVQISLYPWVRDHIIRPAYGFRARAGGPELCRPCRVLTEEPVLDSKAEATRPAHGSCPGTSASKIRFVVDRVKRQQGKTTGTSSTAISACAVGRNNDITYIGASEDQGERIFEQKFQAAVDGHPELKKRIRPVGTRLRNAKRNNVVRYVPASPKASVGQTTNMLIIDEARDLTPKTIMRAIPTVIAADSAFCPDGHFASGLKDAPPACPSCGLALEENYGVVIMLSNAGEEEGLFYELVEFLRERPHIAYHLFESDETLNPRTSDDTVGAVEEVFGELPSSRHLVAQEMGNIFAREGDKFIPSKAFKAHTFADLRQLARCDARAVAFIDCSRSIDLTMVTIGIDPRTAGGKMLAPDAEPFDALDIAHLMLWDPADEEQCPGGRVDYPRLVYPYISRLIPGFTRLLVLGIDIAGLDEAQKLFDWCREQPWGGVVQPWHADRLTNLELSLKLEDRLLGEPERLRLPSHPRLTREAKHLKRAPDGTMVDGSKRHSKGRPHKDGFTSIGAVCWLADQARSDGRAMDQFVRANSAADTEARVQLRGKRDDDRVRTPPPAPGTMYRQARGSDDDDDGDSAGGGWGKTAGLRGRQW